MLVIFILKKEPPKREIFHFVKEPFFVMSSPVDINVSGEEGAGGEEGCWGCMLPYFLELLVFFLQSL